MPKFIPENKIKAELLAYAKKNKVCMVNSKTKKDDLIKAIKHWQLKKGNAKISIIKNNGNELTGIFMGLYKKVALVHAIQLNRKTIIKSLEGEHSYNAGDYKVTNKIDFDKGIINKSWGIKRETFEVTYEKVRGMSNIFRKKAIPVKAYKLLNDEKVKTSWGQILDAKSGDLLLVENKDNMWSIKPDIFANTYQKLS